MRLVVFGAGGHSKETADLLEILGHTIVGFVDDDADAAVHPTTGVAVYGALGEIPSAYDGCLIAIGDCESRRSVAARIPDELVVPPMIHPSASVSRHATVGKGTMVMQNCVVSADASVGRHSIVNVGVFVSHDCDVGDWTHLAPGVQLGGGASVGRTSLVGTSSVVLPGVSVGEGCVIGAGAVVVRDAQDRQTLVGVPASVMGQ